MPTTRWQPAFSAGVLGPGLHGRMDLSKYDIGLKVGENVFIHAHGGVSNRAGTEYIADVMNHDKTHRLIPFKRGDGTNHMLLLGDLEMKIIDDGAFLQSGGSDYSVVMPFAHGDLMALDFVQSIDVVYFAHRSYYPRKLSRASEVSWSIGNILVDPTIGSPGTITFTNTNSGDGTEETDYDYVISAIDANGAEGLPSAEQNSGKRDVLAYNGCKVELDWPDVTDAASYNVYRKKGGSFGYIGYSNTSDFIDDNISADTTLAPYKLSGVFSTSDDYPGVVSIIQQRLVFASSNNLPETMWFSRVGDYENFSKSEILRDSDRIEMDITGQSLNKIEYLIQLRELLVFAETGEWGVIGPDGGLAATNIAQTQYGYSGVGNVKPIVAEDTALFVDRTNRNVRDLRFAIEQDGYSGNDLTIFAYHYFEGREIVSWAFQKSPFYIVWIALDDGTVLSLTYKREHQVWAWARHDFSDGIVEDMAVIPENGEDALYMIVRRDIGGVTKRFVERMASRVHVSLGNSYHVDCGVKYSGAQTNTVAGLDHLEGETVVAVVDGVVERGLTVSSGSVTTSASGSNIHVGYFTEAEIETLPPPIDLKDVGSSRGRPIKASRAFVQVENTMGIKVGPKRDLLTAYEHSETGLYTGTIAVQLFPDWNRDGTIIVRQPDPLPMTVLGIAPDYSIGRTAG